MSVADALTYWKAIEQMAGTGAKVHISGGEVFGNWPGLLDVLRAAEKEGLRAYEVETNAFWCNDRQEAYERCRLLDEAGIGRLVVSCDVYHQEHVDFECVKILVETASEVLGPERVRVRWRDFFANPIDASDMGRAEREQLYREAWQNHHDRLTGRAAREVAPLLELHQAEEFAGLNCSKSILAGRHVHIDPAGNVFPGVCAGLMVGNVREKSLAELWDLLVDTHNEILLSLIKQGPYGLMEIAKQFGYESRESEFANKCHLCAQVRRFLYVSGEFRRTIGPGECYCED